MLLMGIGGYPTSILLYIWAESEGNSVVVHATRIHFLGEPDAP